MLAGSTRPLTAVAAGRRPADVSLLGGFQVNGGRSLPLPAQRMLAYLAIHRHRQSRSTLAGLLWPKRTEPAARLNLRQAIFLARRRANGLVRSSRAELWLEPTATVDLVMVTADIDRLLATPAEVAGTQDWCGLLHDLLPDWDEAWLVIERERFRELRLHALETLSAYWLRACNWAHAIDAALAVVAVDPLRESAVALLVQAFLSECNQARATEVYESYRARLRKEVGVDPSNELTSLMEDRGSAHSSSITLD